MRACRLRPLAMFLTVTAGCIGWVACGERAAGPFADSAPPPAPKVAGSEGRAAQPARLQEVAAVAESKVSS